MLYHLICDNSASALLEFDWDYSTVSMVVEHVQIDGWRFHMQLDDHTHLEFVNNTASYGGAICALPTQVHGYTFTDKCVLNPSK